MHEVDGPFHTTHRMALEWGACEGKPAFDPLLDAPSDSHPFFDAVMADALVRIYMALGNGRASVLDGMPRGGDDAHIGPGGSADARLIVDQLEWDYRFGAKTHGARFRVILQAQRMAWRLLHSDRTRIPGTGEWEAAIVADDRSCRVIAAEYGSSKSEVSRIKQKAKEAKEAKARERDELVSRDLC